MKNQTEKRWLTGALLVHPVCSFPLDKKEGNDGSPNSSQEPQEAAYNWPQKATWYTHGVLQLVDMSWIL
ncbi:hypothetical protein SAMD00023353_11800150 [Rosellinia necatrix]|uniref:Uncharacterized protein n=1 Tax=Rosellinia necatrix TaxID=77044 RepID=A0A1S8AB75_ROSNE|nr:hypothetical protein SAMD00023353_11800150 [Rosellinia necatrix]